ncbi:MAG: hypothetical protein A2821_02315 [Candidatus Magasanikbacteria bacterium RIFCSPHIGHO2_01_FULL_41_23]|uniref:Uncharacterized protein n=1 Tax=Candidatus Magasanikbacteria bacterium RIFCSPLOWO2_01_FULL_40_15 TaxID=1798686 RepID=A0A1F6N2Y4_9BACT|nr:MAG: hypothetical protein A2821_02315 [Candidatus Magasanikbacteria bacterium RIFCSPHIGHO2_01_FULL_41_23]OGH66850.1 MAG: hypothetical protein A3C66_02100 [Candidatus Magasanikbacteria bacterium RIFCSPHIGHO2_02_FULL_41_35]OGH74833.1 MAG: hypothetical protein A3F22_04025 [Candidatus Magasanikbacteria bacterium RIFCSPHIGHO2_12_FULL_41_16]OGH78108.1 MAG: hypothetical protein A2983_03450 [Candidatus Magasanikbacteria bacterium RIFCSPLOWO2_01_FULL_40_15]
MKQIWDKLKEHDKRFDQIDGQIDFLAIKVLEHDDRLQRIEENMATKADLRTISDTLDKLVGLALKKDQEVTFLTHSVKGLWNKFEEYDLDIKQMKLLLELG